MRSIIGIAFAAGMVSIVNPCGFAMLPAYLGYLLGGKRRQGVLKVGMVVAAGFMTVFVLAGTLITTGVRSVIHVIPWLAVLIGVGLMVVGVAQLLGRRLLPDLPSPSRVRKDPTPRGMFIFGLSYAVASLSCTLPIFLSLLAGSVVGATFPQALSVFASYALGMGLAVVGITALISAGKEGLILRIRPLARRLDLISGVVMTAAGALVVWYWATVLTVGATALSGVEPVRWVDRFTAAVAGQIIDHPGSIAAAVAVVALVWWLIGNRRQNNVGTPTLPRGKGPKAGKGRLPL